MKTWFCCFAVSSLGTVIGFELTCVLMHLSLKMKIAVNGYGNERLIAFADQNQRWYQMITIGGIQKSKQEKRQIFFSCEKEEQGKVQKWTFNITEEERREDLFFNWLDKKWRVFCTGAKMFPYTTLPCGFSY